MEKDDFLYNVMILLKKKDIHSNFKTISKMITDYILNKLNPYMYIIITIIVVIFFTNIINCVLIIYMLHKWKIQHSKLIISDSNSFD
jgi:F0F1-type ATP synthase membrane subunit a